MPDQVATYHRTGSGALRVGAGAADITPDDDLYLGGFDLARRSTGVHSRLEARAIVFEVGELRVAVVGVDNLGLHRQDVDWIKAGIPGFKNGDVFVCASHTHAAPDLIGIWGFYLLSSGRDLGYLKRVRLGVVDAIRAAVASLRPARLVRGQARTDPQGWFKNTNRDGVFDRRLTVLQAYDADSGAPLCALLHVPCHPEVLRRRNTLVSADFAGDLCERWHAAGLGQAVFVNGAIGALVSPEPSGVEGVAALGGQLFEAMRASLDDAMPVDVRDAEVRRRDVYVPLDGLFLSLARTLLIVPRELYSGHVRTTVGYLRLGSFEALAVPGEIEPGFAASITAQVRRPGLLVFGLTDDELGYLMSPKDARDPLFGYERSMSPGPDTGEEIRRAIVGPE